jgi:hypothetical protein
LKAFDEREPGADRQRPEHEGACHAKQEHATLILGGNVEFREDDDEDEDVVDRRVSNASWTSPPFSGEAQKHVMRVPGSLASIDQD